MKTTPRTVWITGAGSGIGEALAVHYASQGDTVVISGRSTDKLTAVAERHSGRIIPLTFDVTRDDRIETTRQALRSITPHLDLLILNAGSCEYIRAPELDTALFRRVMDTNYFGVINSIIAALPLLEAAPSRPHVAGVCSLAGLIGFPRAAAYGASKAAAAYLLNALRTDFGDLFDVTVINPGFVDTPMTARNRFPMPFLMSPEDAARVITTKLERRPFTINFPRRLTWILRLLQLFHKPWYRHHMKKADSQRDRTYPHESV